MTETDKFLAVEQAIENCDHICDDPDAEIHGKWVNAPGYDYEDGRSVMVSAGYVRLTCDCGWEEEI